MTQDNFCTTRRSALKIAGGAAVGTVGLSGSATATDNEWRVTTDDNGNSQWVLRFENTPGLTGDSLGVEQAKNAAVSAQQAAVDALSGQDAYTVEKQFWLANAMLVTAKKDPSTAESELSTLSGVRQTHPNFEVDNPEPVEKQQLIPEQHGFATYGLKQINALDVWEQFGTKGEGTSVAVLDTGIDADHPDLELAEDGWAFFNGDGNQVDSEPFDNAGHGTHVSGTIAGGDASGAHIGVAPAADLYNAKVLDNGGTFAQILAGMEWAVEKGVDVINMSLGAGGYFDTYIEPVQHAVEQGTLVVSSSGNSGAETSGSPANVFESFAVGATDNNRNAASFSSGERISTADAWSADWLTGDWPINYYVPNVAAPGVSVLSAYPNGEYTQLSGTSMASPHTAGAAALLLSAKPELSVGEIKEYFQMTAVHGDGPDALPGPRYGEGIIDILSTITAADGGNLIEGTVTYDGESFAGATVKSDFGTQAETDSEGNFSLYVADGEWTFSVDGFGYSSAGVTADISDDTTLTQDIVVEDDLGVDIVFPGNDVVDKGNESGGTSLNVEHLESVSVSLLEESDLEKEHLELVLFDLDDQQALGSPSFDEEFELSEPFSGELFVGFNTDKDAPTGDVLLSHTFGGLGEEVGPVETGPTTVMESPEPAALEINEWDETTEVEMGPTLEVHVEVENTGDRTARQAVQWWLGDPNGPNVFTAESAEVKSGDSLEATFSIGIPGTFVPPGTKLSHGWKTADDVVDTEAEFTGPLHVFSEVDSPQQVDYKETFEVTATLENTESDGSESIRFLFNGTFIESKEVAASAGGTETVTFEFDSSRVVRDNYEFELLGPWAADFENASYVDSVWIGPEQVPSELEPYVNDDLIVDTEGLQKAITDWRVGDIGTDLLRDIIEYWRSGQPVA